MWPEVRKAWDDNFLAAVEHRKYYFDSIRRYLLRHRPKYFRWHVSGDILSQDYFDHMLNIAQDYFFVQFLVFTKNYNLSIPNTLPYNLSLIFSAWPGVKLPTTSHPIAFIEHPKEKRTHNVVRCPGHCETCRACWSARETGHNILLPLH
jgi:hypothetical protein